MNSVQGVFANRNAHGDFIVNAFNNLTAKPCGVYAAIAFFTDAETVEEMVKRGCTVKMIVRLGFPTSPQALRKLIKNDKVQIRYVTSTTFHPKVYVFGEQGAVVGSANLTRNALRVNQEVAVLIERTDPRFDEIMTIFYGYWAEARVLKPETIDAYEKLCRDVDTSGEDRLHDKIKDVIGDVRIQNITVGGFDKTKRELFTEDYEKSYQEFLSYFQVLQSVYESTGRRKVPESAIPLRLEIDSFISFVRHEKCAKETWRDTPIFHGQEQRDFIKPLVLEWFEFDYKWFTENIVPTRYPMIRDTFKSPASIKAASDDTLFEALCTCHAFSDQLHRVRGGLPGLKKVFFEQNTADQIRDVISYLVHGQDDYITRMARCIYQPETM